MPLYKDASAPVEERVRDLLGRMTLREKAGQMAQIERTVVSRRALSELGAGSVLNGGGSAPSECDSPAQWARMVDGMQRLALSSRLGIPILYGTDAVHGHNNVYGATVFPHNVGLGATRCRSIDGITSWDGGTDNGINEGDTICSYDDLERIHIAPYLDCIAQGVATVMASHSRWNGERLHGSRYLLTDVLKGKLGFKGFCDFRLGGHRQAIFENFLEDLVFLVETGEIPMSRIDDAVERILRVKFISGVFEHPFSDPSLLDMVGCKEHRLLAREAVRKSMVLLKNGKNQKEPFLPLAKNVKRIRVTGTHADDIGFQCGGWTISWAGNSGKITPGTSILEAIKESVGVQTEVVYEACATEATIETGEFSYAVVVVGEVPYSESEGDRTDLSIPFNGSDLITCVASKIPTLVIVVSGRPLDIEPQVLEKIYALVAAWLPGTEGMGIADCLFGHHDFVGTLPVTWHRSVDQLPIHTGDGNYDPYSLLVMG
ncbi:hypothetical protein HU200_062782 [Digitaria exilis]|uniref:Beta-glucosidase n=1 Tax=Digitaria exilis TaxID=1010633 RepID=A0A835A598_9POAL|nr:hypothetical protein HU200_062782 [Digitaria exilis]